MVWTFDVFATVILASEFREELSLPSDSAAPTHRYGISNMLVLLEAGGTSGAYAFYP